MRFLSTSPQKIAKKYVLRKSWITMILMGMFTPLSSVYAQTHQLPGEAMVDQFIVELKPGVALATNNMTGSALSVSSSQKPLARLKLLINRVQERSKKNKPVRLLRAEAIQATIASEAIDRMQAEKAIDNDIMVISLERAVPADAAQKLMDAIAQDNDVKSVAPDVRVSHFLMPDDPDYSKQWGYSNGAGGANLPLAWDQSTGSPDVVVAVIDTGYLAHADLKGNLLPGYDFISDARTANRGNSTVRDGWDYGDWITEAEANDPDGQFYRCGGGQYGNLFAASSWHGSHVAGTIGALSNNRLGVSGISWKGKIVPVRVLGKCGGRISDAFTGMLWAAGLPVENAPVNPYPAKVLNLSLGAGAQCFPLYANIIQAVKNKGVTIVVAAGNSNVDVSGAMPANCPGVIAVGATDVEGDLAWFSNYGAGITISAPGVNILSTVDAGTEGPARDDYKSYNGTSMAAPHVAGVVALMLAVNPQLTSEQILQVLKASARPSNCTTTRQCGAGLLDADNALKLVKQMGN